MLRRLKRIIPDRLKGSVVARLSPRSHPDLDTWKGRRKVVIALAGFYQNLGDMALTYAQKHLIEETLPDFEVLLVPSTHTYSHMKALKRVIGPEDIITTIGGGNMDDVYSSLENARQYVVRSFPKNPIISFPQTIAFSDTPRGRRALRRSARIYRRHPRLVVFGREPRSIELMKTGLSGTRVEMSPDIVLSLHDIHPLRQPSRPRSGILLTIRDDKEAQLTPAERAEILRVAKSRTNDVVLKDTTDVALKDCQPETYEKTLFDFWELLRERRVVITDRLHCMIFCVNTNTPVVVFSNSNHKIEGTYHSWLSGHPFVRYLESFDPTALAEAIDDLWNLTPGQIDGLDLAARYAPLRNALLTAAGRAPE